MRKTFNTDGYCDPELNYMVDLSGRLAEIKAMVDEGKYFTVNRARQYGKTTVLTALAEYLKKEYSVISLDFQMISGADFETEQSFVAAFSRELLDCAEEIPVSVETKLNQYSTGTVREATLSVLFKALAEWCGKSLKKIVLIIDEVDTASNNQVFIDFLAQLRAYYLKRRRMHTFQSVILAGVYDIRNIRRRIRPDDEHKQNSPWNIAADFDVDLSFTAEDIAGMLAQYEADYHTGMDIKKISELLYDYTSGYPFLVSRLCKLMDEKIAGTGMFPGRGDVWSGKGVMEAVKRLLSEKNTLFESLIGKLHDYPELNVMLRTLLFTGRSFSYSADGSVTDMASMFGFIKNQNGNVAVSNRIFETRLYNYYLSEDEMQSTDIYKASLNDKNQFVVNGHLNMRLILEKFVVHFNDIYGNREERFLEEEGRQYFLLYLRPIINGVGNYYIESRTRNLRRTDVIVDYSGERYIVEMKIWHGEEYNRRGERQLFDYLEDYRTDRGYMLSFNFNKKKKTGVREIVLQEKKIIEAVV